jgi:uncharacterized protein YpuA (DUF1002 family)
MGLGAGSWMVRRRAIGTRRGTLQRVIGSVIACAFLLHAPGVVRAADSPTTITIGESNTDAQVQEVLGYFGAETSAPALTVTLADTQREMDGIFDTSGITSAYSSTALTCRAAGSGLDVSTHNITVVTPGLYAMALATAGVDDAALVVAAPDDAPAEGMTALAGVFATWKTGPCASGALNPERQRLALEELALTAEVGQALAETTDSGVQTAADVVLATQRRIVVGRLANPTAVDAALGAEETAAGISVPAAERARLVDLLTRLGGGGLDWGTFAGGWDIGRDDANTAVTMTGRAVGGASAAPTVAAATSTPAPAATATPTATTTPIPPTPAPTAAPYTVQGKVSDISDGGGGGGQVGIAGEGADPARGFALENDVTVTRAGQPATVDQVRASDSVTLTVSGTTNRVTALAAEPAPAPQRSALSRFWPFLAAGALGLLALFALLLLLARRRGQTLALLVPQRRPALFTSMRRAPVMTGSRVRWWSRAGDRPS